MQIILRIYQPEFEVLLRPELSQICNDDTPEIIFAYRSEAD